MNRQLYLSRARLLLLTVFVLVTASGCVGASRRTLETAGPTIRPAPAETLTVLVGYELSDLVVVLTASLVVALAVLLAANVLLFSLRFRLLGAPACLLYHASFFK